MKELSIEEKARRYDEAIEKANELLEIGLKDTRDKRVVLSFFPELAESDDERIRKEIISMFETLDRKDWIAWLEKQGEQKSTDKVELMPTWSKEDERDFDVIYGIIYNSCNAEDASRLIEWLKAIKDRVVPQPQQEWSEEDEKIIKQIIGDIEQLQRYCKYDLGKSLYIEEITWLKSLRPQSNWKPTEEQMDALLYIFRHYTPAATDKLAWDALQTLEFMLAQLKKLK